MIGIVGIEVLWTVLQHHCDEQHKPAQRMAVARLTNRLTPSRNLLAPKLTGAKTGHIFFHYSFILERFWNVSKHLRVFICIFDCLKVNWSLNLQAKLNRNTTLAAGTSDYNLPRGYDCKQQNRSLQQLKRGNDYGWKTLVIFPCTSMYLQERETIVIFSRTFCW